MVNKFTCLHFLKKKKRILVIPLRPPFPRNKFPPLPRFGDKKTWNQHENFPSVKKNPEDNEYRDMTLDEGREKTRDICGISDVIGLWLAAYNGAFLLLLVWVCVTLCVVCGRNGTGLITATRVGQPDCKTRTRSDLDSSPPQDEKKVHRSPSLRSSGQDKRNPRTINRFLEKQRKKMKAEI